MSHVFSGKWITHPSLASLRPVNVFHRQLDQPAIPSVAPRNAHILFRSSFVSSGGPCTAYISADDCYKLYVNGTFVCQGPAPGYPFHYYYNVVDLAPYLVPGINVVAVHTYYQGLINRVWVSGDDRHGLVLDIEENGQTVLSSSPDFRTSFHAGFSECGTFGYQTQFAERYTSGTESEGFEKINYDDSAWASAAARECADWVLFPQPTKQLVYEEILPASVTRRGDALDIDFGAMYVGYLALEASGKSGDRIELYFAQELESDLSPRWKLRCNCDYREEWILSGARDSLNEFDYKSFRYARLVLPEGVRVEHIRLVARHYPFSLVARPNTDDPRLLRIWDLCVRSIRYGVQEVIQDCMEREKGNYLGDGCYTALVHMHLTGDTSILEKLVDDSLRSDFITPGLMTCAACSFMQEIAEYPLMLFPMLLEYYDYTGNKDYLAARYDRLAAVLDDYRAHYEKEDGLLSDLDKWCVVEWPANYRDGYDSDIREGQVCRATHSVIDAHYFGAILAMNKICSILGRPPYRDGEKAKQTFIRAFFNKETGHFIDRVGSTHSSLLSDTFALMYDLVPDKATEERILARIDEQGFTTTMLFGSYPILHALRRLGKKEQLTRCLLDEGAWLNMLREGATTTFEGWGKDAKWNTSLFHLTLTYASLFLTDD